MEKVLERAGRRLTALRKLKWGNPAHVTFEAIGEFIGAVGLEKCGPSEAEVMMTHLRRVSFPSARAAGMALLRDLKMLRIADPRSSKEEVESSLERLYRLGNVWAGFRQWSDMVDNDCMESLENRVDHYFQRRSKQVEELVRGNPMLRLDRFLIDRLCIEEDTFPASATA